MRAAMPACAPAAHARFAVDRSARFSIIRDLDGSREGASASESANVVEIANGRLNVARYVESELLITTRRFRGEPTTSKSSSGKRMPGCDTRSLLPDAPLLGSSRRARAQCKPGSCGGHRSRLSFFARLDA